jgi:hypothetical protein
MLPADFWNPGTGGKADGEKSASICEYACIFRVTEVLSREFLNFAISLVKN